jgi:hypothetical protein
VLVVITERAAPRDGLREAGRSELFARLGADLVARGIKPSFQTATD